MCLYIYTLSESPGALIKIPGVADPNQPDFNPNHKVWDFRIYSLQTVGDSYMYSGFKSCM